MKRFHSILKIHSNDDLDFTPQVVVCETLGDEKDVIRHANNAGYQVYVLASSTSGIPILLNDFTNL